MAEIKKNGGAGGKSSSGAGQFACSNTAAGDLASPDRGAGYFASSNTAAGFRSDFEGIFGGARRIIVLKGGPGTGKSAFLRAAATAAEAAGRRGERFYCSSDPASLDGILADGELAIVDGTAPHVWEPKLPGALEEIVNLGQFWSGVMKSKRWAQKKQPATGWRCWGFAGRARRFRRVCGGWKRRRCSAKKRRRLPDA